MTVDNLLKEGRIIEIGLHYMTDDNIVLIRCWGPTTSTYWVREDDLSTVYPSVRNAYRRDGGKDIRRMNKRTASSIITWIEDYMKNN